jgi:hypothetical protein
MIIEMNVNFNARQISVFTGDDSCQVVGEGTWADWTKLEQVAQAVLDYANSEPVKGQRTQERVTAIEAQIETLELEKARILEGPKEEPKEEPTVEPIIEKS